jgi:cytoskeletal protein CcmA (bactofilin family)
MLFNKKPDETSTSAAPAAAPAPAPSKPSKSDAKNAANDTAMSVIAPGMRVVGDIECSGVLKIEGIVEGSVRGARQLLLGRQGEVKGDLQAREVVLGGKVQGTVIAEERIEIQGTALVNGDVHTKSIIVLEGGRINGQVRMDDSSAGVPGGSLPRPGAVRPAALAS